jgi:hypothetical protein
MPLAQVMTAIRLLGPRIDVLVVFVVTFAKLPGTASPTTARAARARPGKRTMKGISV